MANPTTYYAWVMPTATDLVTDLPADFAVFGQGVDTSMQDLLGGTTGQFLTKNSGTNMDFVWATVSTGGMTSLASGSLSGTSVTLSSIPGTYNELCLVVTGFQPSTDAAQLFMRFNADTGTRYRTLPLGSGSSSNGFTETKAELSAEQDNGSTNSLVQHIIPNYANTTSWKTSYGIGVTNNQTTTTSFNYYPVTNFYNQTAAITGITLFVTSGTFTAGSYVLYGVK